MATAKYLELAVILKAVDQMTGTVRNAVGGTANAYSNLQNSQEKAQAAMQRGLTMGAGARVGLDILKKFVGAYGDVDEAQRDLRASIMRPGGYIDESLYKRFVSLSEYLSRRYAGTQMDYIEMIRAMKENRLDPKDILAGTGEAIAELSEVFKTAPAMAAIFAARLRNDMRVPSTEMQKMVDLALRLKRVGVGHTGDETISMLTEFYSKAGLGASNLKLYGTQNAMELGALGGMFIAKGQDAPSVGTTFRRILDNISNADKLKKVNDEAEKFGKHLVFFDKAGKFMGIKNFVGQLTTLQGMAPQDIASILGPAGSAQGMSGDVLKAIANTGKEDYADFLKRIADQGTLGQAVVEQQKGQNQQWKIAKSDIDNLTASIGKGYNPAVMTAIKLTQNWSNGMSGFVKNHSTTAGVIEGLAAVAVGGLAIGSAFSFLKAAWFYSGMARVGGFLADVSGLTTVTNTVGYIGSTISASFGGSLAAVTGVASGLAEIAAALATIYALYEAIPMIGKGIKSTYNGLVSEVEDTWNYQVNGIKPKGEPKRRTPMAMGEMESILRGAGANKARQEREKKKRDDMEPAMRSQLMKSPHSGEPALHYNPVITIQGNTTNDHMDVINKMLDSHKNEIGNMLRGMKNNNKRLDY